MESSRFESTAKTLFLRHMLLMFIIQSTISHVYILYLKNNSYVDGLEVFPPSVAIRRISSECLKSG